MIAATATFAVVATEASAQSSGPVVIDQLTGFGDIVAGQSLVVTQALQSDVEAATDLTLGGDTAGYVAVQTGARGNEVVNVNDGALAIDANQSATGSKVRATTSIIDGDARLLAGGEASAGAYANTVELGGENASVTGFVDQSSQTTVFAETVADVQYVPARIEFSSQAQANAVRTATTGASHQDLVIAQTNAPSTVEARTDVYVDNAWNLAGRANAAANQANLYNSGGSMVVSTDQSNAGRVRATAIVTAYDYGAATATARAAGNEVMAGNNDIYLELDNTQINGGGVEASASFAGTNGYDAYVGAEAVGNTVTGYTCSTCAGVLNATNNQVNDGNVSAVANTTVNGSGRAVVTGANAVGNSATFYVSRPGS